MYKFSVKQGFYKVPFFECYLRKSSRVVASCIVYNRQDCFEVSEFSVLNEKNYRKGYGSVLLEGVIRHFDGVIILQVLHDNTPAINLYNKYGFVGTGNRNKNTFEMKLDKLRNGVYCVSHMGYRNE